MKFRVFGAKSNRSSESVPKNHPGKSFFWTRKEKKVPIERLFSGLPAGSFFGGCQSCDVYDQRSIFRHYFFCKNFPFPNLFCSWSRNFYHSLRFISAVSWKLVCGGQSYNLGWSGLVQKFLYLFKTFWEVMETSFSSKNSKQVVQTAIFMSKRALRRVF